MKLLICMLLICLSGCQVVQLGQCDQELAETLVYDRNGNPAYAGQAMVQQACQSCHSTQSVGVSRRGAPAGMDFDMVGSRTADPSMPAMAAIERLAASQGDIFDWRSEMYASVEGGRMPPGEAGRQALAEAGYRYAGGAPLEEIASEEGLGIYRNWLACGSPVVERTGDMGASCPADSELVVGSCEIREMGRMVAPNWTSIHQEIIIPACVSCHAPGLVFTMTSQLDLMDKTQAYTAMVGVAAMGDDCRGVGANRIIPNDADGSLLIHKLEDMTDAMAPVCGTVMPIGTMLSPGEIAAVRTWIDNGAMDN